MNISYHAHITEKLYLLLLLEPITIKFAPMDREVGHKSTVLRSRSTCIKTDTKNVWDIGWRKANILKIMERKRAKDIIRSKHGAKKKL